MWQTCFRRFSSPSPKSSVSTVIAPPAGLEPATLGLEIRCSIRLSYGGKVLVCLELHSFVASGGLVKSRGPEGDNILSTGKR